VTRVEDHFVGREEVGALVTIHDRLVLEDINGLGDLRVSRLGDPSGQ